MRRVEGRLFHFGKVVLGIAIQFQYAHFDERIFLVTPYLGNIEWVFLIESSLIFRHDLEIECPSREVTSGNGLEEVTLMAFPVVGDELGRFFVGKVLDTLLGAPMILYPHPLTLRIDEAIGVRTESVHVSVGGRDASVGHHDGHLVEGFGKHRPEVPVGLW